MWGEVRGRGSIHQWGWGGGWAGAPSTPASPGLIWLTEPSTNINTDRTTSPHWLRSPPLCHLNLLHLLHQDQWIIKTFKQKVLISADCVSSPQPYEVIKQTFIIYKVTKKEWNVGERYLPGAEQFQIKAQASYQNNHVLIITIIVLPPLGTGLIAGDGTPLEEGQISSGLGPTSTVLFVSVL